MPACCPATHSLPAGVEVLAEYRLTAEEAAAAAAQPAVAVAVRSGTLLATAFHPELTQVGVARGGGLAGLRVEAASCSAAWRRLCQALSPARAAPPWQCLCMHPQPPAALQDTALAQAVCFAGMLT